MKVFKIAHLRLKMKEQMPQLFHAVRFTSPGGDRCGDRCEGVGSCRISDVLEALHRTWAWRWPCKAHNKRRRHGHGTATEKHTNDMTLPVYNVWNWFWGVLKNKNEETASSIRQDCFMTGSNPDPFSLGISETCRTRECISVSDSLA